MAVSELDVVGIGNAIVDVMAACEDAMIDKLGMTRGGMMLIDTDQANSLYAAMGPAKAPLVHAPLVQIPLVTASKLVKIPQRTRDCSLFRIIAV